MTSLDRLHKKIKISISSFNSHVNEERWIDALNRVSVRKRNETCSKLSY